MRVTWENHRLLVAGFAMLLGQTAANAQYYENSTSASVRADFASTTNGNAGEIVCKQKTFANTREDCHVRLDFGAMSRDLKALGRGDVVISYSQGGDDKIQLIEDLSFTRTVQTGAFHTANIRAGELEWRPMVTVTSGLRFDCDFSANPYSRTGIVTYRDPQLFSDVSHKFKVSCLPLTSSEADGQREAERAKAQKAEADRKEAARRETPGFKADEAARQIRAAERLIDDAQDTIRDERRIGQISGYVNATRLRQAGEQILFGQKLQARQWRIYKENGGTAPSIATLIARKE